MQALGSALNHRALLPRDIMPSLITRPGSVADYAVAARRVLPDAVWDYVEGGSGEELTIEANRRAFDDVYIAPRHLVDVSGCTAATTLLGRPIATPIGVAPTAYQELIHPDAEIGMVTGAGDAGAPCVISMFATRTIEEIAAASTGPLWLQLYWLRRREALADMARRAADAGFQALVLTVDAPQIGQRHRDIRNGFAIPHTMRAVNLDPSLTDVVHESRAGASALASHADATFDTTVTWADLAWLRGLTDLPIFIKGILTAADAALAVTHGAAGVIVSNHGGRQIDGAVPSLLALPSIVAVVDGRATVVLDGGIRRGRDAFVGLALGADLVLLGRPPLWALAAGGAEAVTAQLGQITAELEHVMALAGRPRVADLAPDAVVIGAHR
jgi:4-hydroxymandelate oxidase